MRGGRVIVKTANKGQDDSTPIPPSWLRFLEKHSESGNTCGGDAVFLENTRFGGGFSAARCRKHGLEANIETDCGVNCRSERTPSRPKLASALSIWT